MLAGRSNYAYQLRNYCSQALGQANRTVVIISATKRKDVEKKLIKMKKLYIGKNTGKYDVRYISAPDFKFRPGKHGRQQQQIELKLYHLQRFHVICFCSLQTSRA